MPSPLRRKPVRREPIRPATTERNQAVATLCSRGDGGKRTCSAAFESEPEPIPDVASPFITPRKKCISSFEGDMLLMTPPTTPSAFSLGKALFQRGSAVNDVVGRVEERHFVRRFIKSRLKTHESGALYISGLPGTGKTALVASVLEELKPKHFASINSMVVDRPELIFGLIATEFGYNTRSSLQSKIKSIEILDQKFADPNMSHVLILDEIDHIMTNDQEVIFKLFEWGCKKTNLIILGIANALDLTDRFLPRLQAHHLIPQVYAFKPYTCQDIEAIIEARLRSLKPDREEVPLMSMAAIRICAAKTAANSGDLRKAFDICRRAIELVEETHRANEKPPIFDVTSAPRVSVQHIAQVCNEAFGGLSAARRIQTLNFQQQAVLCVLMLLEKPMASTNITVSQAYLDYEAKCTTNNAITPLLYSEYLQVLASLEASGLVSVTGVCRRKGLGSAPTVRASRGGGGACGIRTTEGFSEDYAQRKIMSRVQLMDMITALSKVEPLKQLLCQSIR